MLLKYQRTLLVIAALIVGIGIGWVLNYHPRHVFASDSLLARDKGGDYTFIRPLLTCNISENKEFDRYKPLEEKSRACSIVIVMACLPRAFPCIIEI